MNKKEAKKHIDACLKLYEQKGASAVYDYANKHKIKDWQYCDGCDAETPVINGSCLVCGGAIKDHDHIVAKKAPEKITILSKIRKDQDFPGIEILVNGQVAAIVEFNSVKNNVAIHSYKVNADEPDSTVIFQQLKASKNKKK